MTNADIFDKIPNYDSYPFEWEKGIEDYDGESSFRDFWRIDISPTHNTARAVIYRWFDDVSEGMVYDDQILEDVGEARRYIADSLLEVKSEVEYMASLKI